jgi:peptidoglycan/xylan/chitin deacetylase (PgdA/CDA1 family)
MADLSTATLEDLRGPVVGETPVLKSVPLPGGARVAVTVQLAFEAWKGTRVSGNALGSPLGEEARALGVPDYATISSQEYGGQTGIWRILDVLDELGIKAACSTSTLVAEVWPDAVKAAAAAGHEIVGHGYSQDRAMSDMNASEDFEVVAGAVKTFEAVAGQRPYGWSSHGSRRGKYTVLDLMKCGYVYTNDFRNADVPYVVATLGEQKLLSLPRTDEINDMFLIRRTGNPPGAYVEYFKRAFDRLYKEGAKAPKVLACVAHATLTGRPWGASALTECIEYAKSFDDVWITTRLGVAENYLRSLAS